MTQTVEQLWDALQRVNLLPGADVTAIRTSWFHDKRKDAADPEKFGRWLILNNYLTSLSLRLLEAGRADLLRFGSYQVVDQVKRGPLAGAYLALDPLRRKVMLEMLAERHARQPATLQAFQAVAQQALEVRQANLNRILDVGQAHGLHYLVHEYDEGETLADLLARRGRLSPLLAARMFALALAALQTLHDKDIPAGELGADCLLLTAAIRSSTGVKLRNQKLLHWGVPRHLFDGRALQRCAGLAGTEPAGGEGPADVPWPARQSVADELLLLGATFYQSLTGQRPQAPVVPLRQALPEVPEMLADVVEQLIASDPAQRPRSAARAAKTLRVFLASEEETPEHRHEEILASPMPPIPSELEQEPEPAAIEKEQHPAKEAAAGVKGKLAELWEEVRPGARDLLFLGGGAAAGGQPGPERREERCLHRAVYIPPY